MKLLANGTTRVSAQMRDYRSQVAQSLTNLLRPGEPISDIGWEQLERLPAWTLLNTQDLVAVTREIGMVVFATALKKSIDGSLLKALSTNVDALFLRRLLSAGVVDDAALLGKDVEHFEQHPVEAIERAGASVLLSTIENSTLVSILARRFEVSHEMMDSERATHFVEQAEKLKTQSLTQMSSAAELRSAEPDTNKLVAIA